MSAVLLESLQALGWPRLNASAADPVAAAGAVAHAVAGAAAHASTGPNASAALSREGPGPAPAHVPLQPLALGLMLAAVLVVVACEARDWLLRKRALALEQAFG